MFGHCLGAEGHAGKGREQRVIMTRQGDQSPARGTVFAAQQNGQLASRVAIANRSPGQVFISLHNDWNDDRSIKGTSVHYYKSQDLALARGPAALPGSRA